MQNSSLRIDCSPSAKSDSSQTFCIHHLFLHKNFTKNIVKKSPKNSDKKYDNFIKQNSKNNPFAQKCENCTTDMWEYIKQKAEELENKCSTNTYVWIEKFKDDN